MARSYWRLAGGQVFENSGDVAARVLHPVLVELLALGRRGRHAQQHLLLLLVGRVFRQLLHYVRPDARQLNFDRVQNFLPS